MTEHDIWKLTDAIKRGFIEYSVGDSVVVFRRKKSGHPRGIKDGIVYTIKRVDNDSIEVATHSSDGIGWNQPMRVHKTFMISMNTLREYKLKKILEY